MNPIERSEILPLGDYEAIRDTFRARVIGEKKHRRISLGPVATCVFENRDTVLLQIQEMLRTERITREDSIAHEIATYNELVPRAHELSATIFIEIVDPQERERFLSQACGLEQTFALRIDGIESLGVHDAARTSTDRTTAVHYIKFPLTPEAEARLRTARTQAQAGTGPSESARAERVHVELVANHPAYSAAATLPWPLVISLAGDLV